MNHFKIIKDCLVTDALNGIITFEEVQLAANRAKANLDGLRQSMGGRISTGDAIMLMAALRYSGAIWDIIATTNQKDQLTSLSNAIIGRLNAATVQSPNQKLLATAIQNAKPGRVYNA